jgi:Zn-dependent metalloprotease
MDTMTTMKEITGIGARCPKARSFRLTGWTEVVDGPFVDAHWFAGHFYDWILTTFERNSFDGSGASMISSVDYPCADVEPCNVNRAYWNGSQVVFLTAGGANRQSYAACPDVVGHEWAHAITDYESNLVNERNPER